jgi:membrane protein
MNEKKESWGARAARFFRCGIWEAHSPELSKSRKALLHGARMAIQVVQGFKRDRCPLHAASLTFFSLMALIPVLALTLAVARAFGGGELAKTEINRHLDSWMAQMEQPAAISPKAGQEQPAVSELSAPASSKAETAHIFTAQVREIADKLMAQVDKINFGTLGGIGAVMLFWTVISVLGKVESSFNEIWGIGKPRTFYRKISDYLCTTMILPFLMIAASTVPVAARIKKLMDQTVGGNASSIVKSLLDSGFFKTAVTFVLASLTFAYLLGFMPNTKVKTLPALTGGSVTALFFGLWFKLCAMLQIGIAKYSALYGGFAVLPILLMWVYASWEIILFGAEIAFAVQNRGTYTLEKEAEKASMRSRFLLALAFCAETAQCARLPNGGPFSAADFARRRGIPQRFVQSVLAELTRSKVLAEVADQPGSYLLYRCGESLTAADLFFCLFGQGTAPEALGLQRLDARVWALQDSVGGRIRTDFSLPIARLLPKEGAAK